MRMVVHGRTGASNARAAIRLYAGATVAPEPKPRQAVSPVLPFAAPERGRRDEAPGRSAGRLRKPDDLDLELEERQTF